MFSSFQETDLYNQRLKKDVVFMLAALFPSGGIVRAEDILALDNLNSNRDPEELRKELGCVIDTLKERKVNYEKERDTTQNKVVDSVTGEQSAAPRMQVLF